MKDNTPGQKNSRDWIKILLWGAFIVSASVTAVLALGKGQATPPASETVRGESADSTSMVTQEVLPTLEENYVFQERSNRPEPVELDLEKPVVVLITGVDTREWEGQQGPGLTDVVIVGMLDAQKHTAGLLSLPRDMWVEVPGFGHRKVNQVYPLGEGYGYRGGGIKLLMETVESYLDTDINYYVQVDFKAFVTLVDAMGGVKVDVQERLVVDPDPAHNGMMKRLETGVQVLPGDLALGYIRTRSTGEGDFGRAKRQQQVLVALQRRVIEFEILPRLIRQAPYLYRELSSHIETNLTLGQITKLAWAVKDVDTANIEHRVLSPPVVEPTINYLGQYVLIPQEEALKEEWDKIYRQTANQLPQPTDQPSQQEVVSGESAQISVLNGTTRVGLAGDTANYFQSQGLKILRVDNAEKFSETTVIYDYTGNPATIRYLLEVMGLSESHVYHRVGSDQEADIVVILGSDWARENTLP